MAPPRRPPVLVTVCGCDACSLELPPGAAQADGYCHFCALRCFPVATFKGGEYTRFSLSRASRDLLHSEEDGDDEELAPPVDPTQQMLQQVAAEVGSMVVPKIEQMFRKGIKKLFK